MAQYENYKLTYSLGFEKIPEEWNLKKVKYLFNIGRGRVISQEELMDNGLYPVFSSQTQNNGCLGYINTFDFDCEQLTWTTDGANAGTVFIRSGKHNCTNVCGTLQPIKNQAHLKFSHYALQYATQFHKRPDTNGAKIMNNEMAEISFALPSQQEQFKIVEYLNYETAKIDSLIAKQEKLIELLKEKRQAVISHAVTKGLNPNVAMKDSGVEWLGQVPEHWTVKPNKYLLDFVTSGSRGWAQFYADTGSLFFRIANLTRDTIEPKLESLQFVEPPQGSEGERSKIKIGDLLISITADLGSVCVADSSIQNGYVSQHVALCRPQKLYNSRWLAYYILSDSAKEQLLGSGYGGTKIQLSLEDIKELVIAVPPKEEQILIANYIDEKLNQFEHLIKQANKLVMTLQERRTALISSAVTGKIDVRHHASRPSGNDKKQKEGI